MIYIARRRYIELEASTPKVHIGGEFRAVVSRADGSVKSDTGYFKNLVLDSGLNRMGSGLANAFMYVSTNNTAPSVSDTGMGATYYSTSNTSGVSSPTGWGVAAATPPYFGTAYQTRRFAIGTLSGTFSSVGIGWDASNNIFAKSLVVDGLGAPTTFSVGIDEQLDLTYRWRTYVPDADYAHVATISGVNYDITTRGAHVTSSDSNFGVYNALAAAVSFTNNFGGSTSCAYNGAIGSATGFPSGTVASSGTGSTAAYVNNSLSRSGTLTMTTAQGNLAGGISALRAKFSNLGYTFQMGISPPIPKDDTKTLVLNFTASWGRR